MLEVQGRRCDEKICAASRAGMECRMEVSSLLHRWSRATPTEIERLYPSIRRKTANLSKKLKYLTGPTKGLTIKQRPITVCAVLNPYTLKAYASIEIPRVGLACPPPAIRLFESGG